MPITLTLHIFGLVFTISLYHQSEKRKPPPWPVTVFLIKLSH